MAGIGNREMPTFFVIGAGKCGTTSLHHYLDLHPEISMSSIKEPDHFLSREASPDDNSIRSRDEYLALFESGTKHRGESSTSYSQAPVFPGVPGRIAAEVPEARLVYLVRDPVDRIRSAITQKMSTRRGAFRSVPADASMAEILGDFRDPANLLASPSDYIAQIRAYLEHFPAERLIVVDSDELRSGRREAMARIFEFLGVDRNFWDEGMEDERNRADEKRRVSDGYISLSQARPVRLVMERLPRTLRRRISSSARSVTERPWTPPEMDPDLREELRAFFRPSVEELREFTGQRFPGWSI